MRRCRTRCPTSTAVQCCGGTVTVLLEPLPVVPAVAIFGVGHVGLELARILARQDIDLHLIDTRPQQLADDRLAVLSDAVARVQVHRPVVLPETVLGDLPAGTHVLIMTHDHAEDLALCDAVLRGGSFGSVGLIGSAGKWARFRRKLAGELGHDEEAITRIKTPIGLPGIAGKEPATIAVSVAADLLGTLERIARDRGHAENDAVPGPRPRRPRQPVPRRRGCAATSDGGLLVDGGGASPSAAPFAAAAGAAPGRAGPRPAPRAAAARSRRHARALPAAAGDRRARHAAARVAGALRAARGGAAGRRRLRARGRRASSSTALADAGTTTALVFGAHFAPAVDVLFEAAAARGLRVTSGLVVGDRLPAPRAAHHARARLRRGAGPRQPVARHRAQPVRRDPSVLAVVHRRPARVLRRAARGGTGELAHQPPQREPGRDRPGPRAVRLRPTSTATTGTGSSARAASSRTTCTPPTPS